MQDLIVIEAGDASVYRELFRVATPAIRRHIPSGSRTARLRRALDTFISMRFMDHRPSQSSARAAVRRQLTLRQIEYKCI
jgi:hypothetical protein